MFENPIHNSPIFERVLGVLAIGLALMLLAYGAHRIDGVQTAPDAGQHIAGDGCHGECPGELPDGGCADDCQYCGCCSTLAAAVGVDSFDACATTPLPRENPPQWRAWRPDGVSLRIFKPPRHLST